MGAGANAGGFAAGFGKGLSNALLRNRERSDQRTKDEQSRKDRLFQALLPTMLENVEDRADLEPFLAQQFPEQFGTPGKGAGKKGQSPFDNIKRFIGPLIGMRGKQPMANDLPEQGGFGGNLGRQPNGGAVMLGGRPMQRSMPPSAQPPGVTGGTLDFLQGTQQPGQVVQPTTREITDPAEAARIIGTPVGGSTAPSSTAGIGAPSSPTGAPPRWTLMGVPIMSAEEKAVALVKRAQTILPALRTADPTATLEDAFSILRTGTMTRDAASRAASQPQVASVGDLVLQRDRERAAKGLPPMTSDEKMQFIAEYSKLNDRAFSMGTLVNQALADLGLTEDEARRTGRMGEVNKKAEELAAGRAGSQAAARNAETTSIVQTGAGPQVVNRGTAVATPITQGQVGGAPTSTPGAVVGPAPTAEMRNRDEARRLVIPAINEIEALGNKVITKVGPAQRADALKRGAAAVLGSDAEWRTYQDARTALAGNLAVLQQGSRPSDADIQAIWLPLVPDTFSDTTESAKMKRALIRRMSGLDPMTGQPVPRGGTGAGGANPADSARRLRARQVLNTAKKQTDDATIDTFLRNNPDFK